MDKKCSYAYDPNGVRISKKANGHTTNFNVLGSKILAQESIDGYMYFQYSGDELIGFHLNDAQYFYIKNLNGDIVGIEDYDGNLIAQYEYDEWGKLLNITTAEEGNEEQLRIANANPFRYRSYYYDNETGYYYLQSRYYNPEWGRFISADDLTYINNTRLTRNAYIYCINNPINGYDPTGLYYFNDTEKTNNWFEIALKILTLGIEIDAITDVFESVIQVINPNFNFNNWYDSLNEQIQNFLNDSVMMTITIINTLWDKAVQTGDKILNDFFSLIEDFNDKLFGECIDQIADWIFNKIHFGKTEYEYFKIWTLFTDSFWKSDEYNLSTSEMILDFLVNLFVVVVGKLSPLPPLQKTLLMSAATSITNLTLDIVHNFDNGRFWGGIRNVL